MAEETIIREFREGDIVAIVELSLRAWEPVFASVRQVLGDDIFLRLHPDWKEGQADAVRSACMNEERDVFVAVAGGRPVGFVAVALNAFHAGMRCVTVSRTTLALAVVGVALFAGLADCTAARGSAVEPSLTNQFANNVAWSPDGSMLLFEREHNLGQTTVWVVRASGIGARRVAIARTEGARASWVPASELRSFEP